MKYYKVKGVTRSLTEWAALAGITRQAMSQRVKNAKSPEQLELALLSEDKQGKSFRKQAERLTEQQVCDELKRR